MRNNKLYIFTNSQDRSTRKVMGYLNTKDVIRLNAEDSYYIIYCDLENVTIQSKVKGIKYNICKNDKIWFRQGLFSFDNNIKYFPFLGEYLFKESRKLQKTIFYVLSQRKEVYGNIEADYEHNKLIDLLLANNVGFKTPQTYLVDSTSISNLEKKDYITKSIYNPKNFQIGQTLFSIGKTKLFNPKKITKPFSTSLIQELIPKKYEIRSFVFSKKIFSMCIFSQSSEKSRIDFRAIGNINKIRLTPYNLPSEMEDKIYSYMQRKQLNSGSFDFIVTPENEYIFLELNPVGQFDWLSYHCNYQIEKYISSKLKV